MDPEATMRALNRALRDQDIEAARNATEDLFEWINRGGFLPRADQCVGLYEKP